MGGPLASTTADQQPLAAVTLKKQWQLATSELRHGHQFAAQGYFAPLVRLKEIIVRRSRSAIRTTRPNANSANPITGGWLQGGCCLVRGPRSTRRGTECQRAAYKHNSRNRLHGELSTGARTQQGVQRISDANIRHGRQTKQKLVAQRHAAKVGRRVRGELKRIERRIVDAGLMPDN
jgi:hypothetical protein